jgi:hypothetical protein
MVGRTTTTRTTTNQTKESRMSRSRKSAKGAGTAMETLVTRFLASVLNDDRIERRRQSGSKDRGDVAGVRTVLGERVVIEVKDYGGRLLPGTWVEEARVEAGNDDAPVGVVVAKRRGTTNPADQFVLMTLADLAVLLGAQTKPFRPDVVDQVAKERNI